MQEMNPDTVLEQAAPAADPEPQAVRPAEDTSIPSAPEAPAAGGNTVEAGGLLLNQDTYQVTKNGRPVDLTQKEYDLLSYLIRERGKVFSREDLMQRVWNYEYYGDMRTVDVTVRRLREKIEDDPGKPRYILTRRGVGYYFAG